MVIQPSPSGRIPWPLKVFTFQITLRQALCATGITNGRMRRRLKKRSFVVYGENKKTVSKRRGDAFCFQSASYVWVVKINIIEVGVEENPSKDDEYLLSSHDKRLNVCHLRPSFLQVHRSSPGALVVARKRQKLLPAS